MASIPPFSGFPEAGLHFLRDLEKNNEREWFQARKQDYLDYIVAPAQSFVQTLGEALQSPFPGIRYDTRTNGQGSMGRIYRDIRFSKDKRPYNTHVWFAFWDGPGKKMASPGFGIGFDTEGWGLHGGSHMFDKPQLEAYREAVLDETLGRELEAAVAPLQQSSAYEIGEMKYKRVPRGFDPEHPRARWLRYGSLWASRDFRGTELLQKPEFVNRSLEECEALAPLHRWLVTLDQKTRPGR